MKLRIVALLSLAGLAAVVLFAGGAEASAVTGSCSNIVITNGGLGSRTFYFGTGDTAGTSTSCGGGSDDILEATSGDSFTLECRESTLGVPPSAPQTLTLSVYSDADSYAVAGGATGRIWATTVATNTCAGKSVKEVYCTSDGTSTGSPRFGTLRIVVRATRTSIPTYDVLSDGGGNWGMIRCNPRLTAFTDGNPSTSPSTYVGGDTLRTSATLDAAPYTSGDSARVDLLCAAATNTPGSLALTSSAVTVDATVKGTSATWPDDCTISQKLVITKAVTITGLTAQPLFKWDTTSPIAGVTYSGQEASRTAAPLDRTATLTSCSMTHGAESAITVIGRGKTVTLQCTAQNARATNIGTGALGICYTRRTTQALTDTTDAPSTNCAGGASGLVSYTVTLDTDATHTNGTALDYATSLEWYGASRTSGELYNYGSSAGFFDVSSALDVTNLSTWRNVCNVAAQASTVFWIDHHVVCQREGPVQDPRGNLVTTSLSFSRTYSGPSGASIPADSEGSVTTGTSTAHYTVPKTPAGTWTYSVTVTDGLGNSGTRSQSITFTSTSPGDEGGETLNAGDPLHEMGADYSWDSHRATITVSFSFLNGTSRPDATPTVRIYHPDGTELVHGQTPAQLASGVWFLSVYLGTSPDLGVWNATAELLQPGSTTDYVTGGATFTVQENVPLLLADIEQLMLDLQALILARTEYTNSLVNDTASLINGSRALDEANFTLLDAALAGLAASTTNGPAPWAWFNMTGEIAGPAPGYYAGRSVRFNASSTNNASWGPLLYLWDFGDNETASGPVAYHKYATSGNYTVSLSVFTATGNSTTVTRPISVNLSTPWVNVTGPTHPLQWHRVTYDARASLGHYDDIVKVEWAVNPGEYNDIPFIGSLNINAGSATGWQFNYTWSLVGNQTIRVNVTNAHGVTNTTYYRVLVHDAVKWEETRDAYPDEYGQLGLEMAETAQKGVDRVQRFAKFWAWVLGGFRT